ncbi:hypothetical protein SEA_IBANTIK_88 [Streptomyces phage Ibantik]|uniref:DUF3987 domain-containing protein n=1 Tax=Streptomyces phage Ibantik TaxID=2182397 RepID=A0A2U8UP05_9CAUD|nr:hypothetical protein QEH36_gp077 [Streptomyces phage Ibantik]AWN05310.1 hypothetical protein SEA_IBANTIK_88 [Streptomyces phage Ibantik]
MSLEAFESMRYGPLGDAILEADPYTEADPVGVYAATLALWSSAIGGHVCLWNRRPVVVWTVLAGESAIGRKGTALRVARGMLQPSIGTFLEERVTGGVSSGPSLTQVLYEQQERTEGSEGGPDTRVITIDEEWSENLKRQNRCPTFASKLRNCWDGATIRHTTTRVSMVVPDPRLGFHSHITPGEWTDYIKPRDARGGSYNRLLPVLVHRSKILPYNNRELYPEITGLAEAYDWARSRSRVMTLDPVAGERFDELRVQFELKQEETPKHLSCYVERTPEQILRVAAVLTATERQTVISRKAIDAAWAFVQYSTQSVGKLVREDTKVSGRAIKTLPEMIREALTQFEGKLPHSVLLRKLANRATADSIRTALAGMPDVRVVTGVTSGRGRPGVEYRWANTESVPAEAEQEQEPSPVALTIPEPRPETHTLDNPGTQELMLSAGWL